MPSGRSYCREPAPDRASQDTMRATFSVLGLPVPSLHSPYSIYFILCDKALTFKYIREIPDPSRSLALGSKTTSRLFIYSRNGGLP